MKCVGYDRYEGKCENEAGTQWTPYWCLRCDELRREHITKQFERLESRFKEEPQ